MEFGTISYVRCLCSGRYDLRVNIYLHGPIRELVDGRQAVQVVGNTIGECFEDFQKSFPGVQEHIFGSARQTPIDYLIRVNGVAIWSRELDLTGAVKDGDAIEVMHIPDGG